MRKTIVLAVLAAVLGAGGLRAEEGSRSKWAGLMTYFKHLKQGLTDSAVQGQFARSTRGAAVAAVRGAAQDDSSADPDKPGMKDAMKSRKAKARKAEQKEFEHAVDLINEGKVDEGFAALEAFVKAHPKSPLAVDAKDALAKARELKEMQKGDAVAAPAPVPGDKPSETKTP